MARTGVITVPPGLWVVSGHPSRDEAAAEGIALDPANPGAIDAAQKTAWRKEYPLVTDSGLPVHPLARLGVTTRATDPKTGIIHRLGMATGIGRERHYGASKTGALLLARLGLHGEVEYPVVTEMRGNRLRSSFPGGYAAAGETIAETCVRESVEELKIVGVSDNTEHTNLLRSLIRRLPHILWRVSPSVTGPCTLNAWLAEHFLVVDATSILDMQDIELQAGEAGIQQAQWCSGRELIKDPALLGSHRRALLAHMEVLGIE